MPIKSESSYSSHRIKVEHNDTLSTTQKHICFFIHYMCILTLISRKTHSGISENEEWKHSGVRKRFGLDLGNSLKVSDMNRYGALCFGMPLSFTV